jgi:hypothetical protein
VLLKISRSLASSVASESDHNQIISVTGTNSKENIHIRPTWMVVSYVINSRMVNGLDKESNMELTGFELGTFGAGLGVGLIVAIVVWIGKLTVRSSLQKEIEGLKTHLHTQMSINAKGYEELQKEVETLKHQNENLRITVATLSNKPGRAELKTLHIWDKAIRTLVLNSPAFAPAWEMAIAEAKKDTEETDTGVKALVRRVFSVLPQDQLQQ